MIYRVIALVTLAHVGAAFVVSRLAQALSLFPVVGVGQWIAVFLLLDAVALYAMLERRALVFGRIWWRGPVQYAVISLTFDDGPNEPHTSRVLDVLERAQVKATFFVLGANAERYPETVRRIVADGHELGNHTVDHAVLPLRGPRHIRAAIRGASDIIERIGGVRPRLFRAPHGWRNPWVDRVAREEGCEPVAWTLGVYDTDRPGADVIRRRVIDGVSNGCIVLLHDGRGLELRADASQVAEALPGIIDEARRRGYRFATVGQLIAGERRR
ncbi:MAG: polysaccharide deacetylase family protein [Acidobacteria bacterium]|nr:polysaccharide deacetylase family protein [Acidobacteriota bacterium]